MKTRPWPLLMYAISIFGMASSLPIQICLNNEIPIWEMQEWWRQLTWMNILVMQLLILSCYWAYRASSKLFIFAPITLLVVIINNAWVSYVGTDYTTTQTTLASMMFLFVTCFLLEPKTFRVLSDHRLHWWRTAERKNARFPVTLHPWIGHSINGTTLNVSSSGAFILVRPDVKLQVGDIMQIRLNVHSHRHIRCTARVARKTEGQTPSSQGIGIEFNDLSKYDRTCLKELLV